MKKKKKKKKNSSQKYILRIKFGPNSWYLLLLIQKWSNVDKEAKILPPIHELYCLLLAVSFVFEEQSASFPHRGSIFNLKFHLISLWNRELFLLLAFSFKMLWLLLLLLWLLYEFWWRERNEVNSSVNLSTKPGNNVDPPASTILS